MIASKNTNRRRSLSGASLLLFGAFFAADVFVHVLRRGAADLPTNVAIGLVAPVHLALLAVGLFGITQILRRSADVASLTCAALTLMGWAAGIRITTLGQIEHVQAVHLPAILFKTMVMPGILFPIGLLAMGITLMIARPIPRWIGALLAVGGVLFPIGRIGALPWALVSCDVILAAAFAAIGWQILTREEVWDA